MPFFGENCPFTGQKMKISKIAVYSLESPILSITWPILRFSSAPNLKTNVADQKIGNVKMFDFGPKINPDFHKNARDFAKNGSFQNLFCIHLNIHKICLQNQFGGIWTTQWLKISLIRQNSGPFLGHFEPFFPSFCA